MNIANFEVACKIHFIEDCGRISLNSLSRIIKLKFAHLSMLMAQRLKMLAVHNKTSNEIQNSHSTQPRGHSPSKYTFYVRRLLITKSFQYHSPTENTKTAGGMTKIPTSQSATAKLITKRFVTVLNLRVVMTDKITKVFPIIVITINKQKITISTIFVHGQFSASALFCSVTFIFNHGKKRKHWNSSHFCVQVDMNLLVSIRRITYGWLSHVNSSLIFIRAWDYKHHHLKKRLIRGKFTIARGRIMRKLLNLNHIWNHVLEY